MPIAMNLILAFISGVMIVLWVKDRKQQK